MDKKLSSSAYILVGSMLFGLFFGAGNLIFPVQLGQLAGLQTPLATFGFLIAAIGIPFLGVVAIGMSQSDGLFELAKRVHPAFGYGMTILLYLTIGPFFAMPRTGTVSYEVGLAPYIPAKWQALALALFTSLFFLVALWFALRPGKILVYVGKILNPLFLCILAILILASFLFPMADISPTIIADKYQATPFFSGFLEGYNTMDGLAALGFGIIIIATLKSLGVTSPKGIALGTVKAGFVSVLLMAVIYSCLAYIGATSVELIGISPNGGNALALIAKHYFTSVGSVLLALIITLACLKTAIGLISACADTFHGLFPKVASYKGFAIFFAVFGATVANIGLTQIIELAIPMLMLLYPLAIALIITGITSPLFKHRTIVYKTTILFTFFVSVADMFKAIQNSPYIVDAYTQFTRYCTENFSFCSSLADWLPEPITTLSFATQYINFCQNHLYFFDLGMGWVIPCLIGYGIGLVLAFLSPKKEGLPPQVHVVSPQ